MPSFDVYLTEDLEWREKELTFLKFEALRFAAGSWNQRRILRALWTLLYAHYEGFALGAFDELLTRLESNKFARRLLIEPLLLFSLEDQLDDVRGDQSARAYLELYRNGMPKCLDEPVSFPRDKKTRRIRLHGQSNLYPDKLLETCELLGLSGAEIKNHRQELFILVTRRNEIAHGEVFEPKDVNEFSRFENAAFEVMYGIACELIDCNKAADYIEAGERDQLIRARAYILWELRGKPEDQDLACWLDAERQLSV